MKKIFCAIVLVFHASYSQVRVVDSISLDPIPFVYAVSPYGSIVGISNSKGFIKIDTTVNFKNKSVELSHITYKKKIVNLKSHVDTINVKMQENINALSEVIISEKVDKHDYLVLKGYYRSYQIDNNKPKAFSDGIIEYYIPMRGKKRIKFHLIQNRNFKNNSMFNSPKGGKVIYTENSTGPPYIEKETLFHELKNHNSIEYESGVFKLNNDTIGSVDFDSGNKIKRTQVSFNDPKRVKTKKFMGRTYTFINHNVTESYYPFLKDKSTIYSRSKYIKRIIHQKNRDSVTVESKREFYLIEKKYISKKDVQKVHTSGYFGPHETKYSTEYWRDLDKYKIPPIPKAINALLGKTLALN